jgi:hypothetical protein
LKQIYTRSLIAAFCFHAYQQVVIHLADIGGFVDSYYYICLYKFHFKQFIVHLLILLF